ncbi:hypothetical protein SHALO_1086 [Sulfurospirillum halorespirans DSM 13726]|uniref:Uncharacterized protein n=1 Tax=Sulfurospirillum halorespirans DSM 13726 TaxID=1193502 RepID=A0A1D7TIS0_9BACT|nr:hypothetical protein SHALO_1086 [Sulfurospirillum halorespirans DSM 13726]
MWLFLKCELRFVCWLLIGLMILNSFVYGLAKLLAFPSYFIWVFEGSLLALALYICYFIYQFLKTLIFGYTGECKNLMQRTANWLSNLT